jgi:hypothetical protein
MHTVKKETKWYQTIPTYELITENFSINKNQTIIKKELVVKNDSKGTVKTSAFFVILSFVAYMFFKEESFGYLIMFAIFISIVMVKGLDRKPKFILNNDKLWGYNFENAIPWSNMIAIYFKTEELSDSKAYSLMIHYYDEGYDYFKEIEFNLDGYEFSKEQIIEEIKKFSKREIVDSKVT